MAEPASGSLGSPSNTENGASGDIKLEELRQLVFGPELDQISRLTKRLEDPDQRAEDFSQILPRTKVRRGLEQSIKIILKHEPDVVVEAIRPVLLEAVRKAVADAFREFAESLNQIAEKSLSPRSLLWRLEAARTGKKFSDIMLSRSLLYSVREVFLIHGKTGIMLNQAGREALAKDPDMISSMFTAIQEFVRDSFIGTQNMDLETIDTGAFKLWIQHGQDAMIAGAVQGSPPAELRGVFRGALDEIQVRFAPQLSSFDGDVEPFAATRPILEQCLLGSSAGKRNKPVLLFVTVAVLLALAGTWSYFGVRNQQRWSNYVAHLERQPGIVVTRVEGRAPGHIVYGFRDPLAPNPTELLTRTGIPASSVAFHLEPYDSLEPAFAAQRQFLEDAQALNKIVMRFLPGQADLTTADLDRIENEIAPAMISILRAGTTVHTPVRVQITGHTDEVGTGESNARLSLDRANSVVAALVDAGVNREVLLARGVATAEPVRPGTSDRDRSFNRSVTLRVLGGM